MEITDVRVKLCHDGGDQLKAFCSITLDGYFVVRDLKVIEGNTGLFVAMPSRKLTDRCPKCRNKNHLRARFCNECGAKLRENRAPRGGNGGGAGGGSEGRRSKLYVDVAHPINSDCRKLVQERVVEAYKVEAARAEQPDYVPQDYEEDEELPETVEATEPNEFPETTEYEDLIRELKNDAQARRGGHSPPPEREKRPRSEPVDDEIPIAVEAPKPKPKPRAAPPPPPPPPPPVQPPRERAPAPRPAPLVKERVPVAPQMDDDDGFGAGIV